MSSTDNSAVTGGMPRGPGEANGEAGRNRAQSGDDMADEAKREMHDLKDRADQQASKYTDKAAEQLRIFSEGLRSGAERLQQDQSFAARPLRSAAESLEGLAQSIRSRSGGSMMRDMQNLARDNPGLFYAACAAAGFAAARFLTADPDHGDDSHAGSQTGSYGSQSGYGSGESSMSAQSDYRTAFEDNQGGGNV